LFQTTAIELPNSVTSIVGRCRPWLQAGCDIAWNGVCANTESQH